ncbi:hypothetical protein F5Y16DRAFT_379193 [Xylariaceae sp. FL0255]|nr:hypothetical protein F5Y16DRAFT_379193 [Xylariaceae sp. FL0255]
MVGSVPVKIETAETNPTEYLAGNLADICLHFILLRRSYRSLGTVPSSLRPRHDDGLVEVDDLLHIVHRLHLHPDHIRSQLARRHEVGVDNISGEDVEIILLIVLYASEAVCVSPFALLHGVVCESVLDQVVAVSVDHCLLQYEWCVGVEQPLKVGICKPEVYEGIQVWEKLLHDHRLDLRVEDSCVKFLESHYLLAFGRWVGGGVGPDEAAGGKGSNGA